MISLKLQNLSQITNKHGLSTKNLKSQAKLIKPYLKKIEARDQGFYRIIDDKKIIIEIENFAKKAEGKYDNIIVLGIGGSALGTICLQQSLKHLFENNHKAPLSKHVLDCDRGGVGGFVPHLHIIDNIDPELISAINDIINYKKTLFIVVTKSGSTPETLAQYFYFRDKTDKAKLDAKKHFVFITDPKKGFLKEIGNKEKIPCFDVPENVGGRFSVLTAVGLLPAKLIGIDIKKLIKGAQKMRDLFLSENFEQNLPFQMATIQYLLSQKGKTINVLIPYSSRLIKFADWYRQLLAESIGKELNNKGEKVNIGITPINALGATDQHSQSQLYMEGPNDKLLIFIKIKKQGATIKVPSPLDKGDLGDLSYLQNLTFNTLLHTEMQGTIDALTKQDRPNITLEIDKVDEENLGTLFMLFEATTAFLGEFFDINAFDQPGVELSKILTKKLLTKK